LEAYKECLLSYRERAEKATKAQYLAMTMVDFQRRLKSPAKQICYTKTSAAF
jgi:hypothetical protein